MTSSLARARAGAPAARSRDSRSPARAQAALAGALALLAAGCGRQVDVSTPAVTAFARGSFSAKPLNLCNAQLPNDPRTGAPVQGRTLTLRGSGFLPQVRDLTADRPQVDLPVVTLRGPVERTLPGTSTLYRDPSTIDVLVPLAGSAGLPLGSYDVTVQNPEGTSGALAAALQIVPPPSVQSVSPSAICTTQAQRVVLKGGVFSAGAPPAVAIASIPLPAASVSVDSPAQVTATVPANTLAPGTTTASIDLTDADGCTLIPSASIAVGTACAP